MNAPEHAYPITHLTGIISLTETARYIEGGMPDAVMNSLSAAYEAVVDEIIATPSICHRDLHAKFDVLRTLQEEGSRERADKLTRFATVSDFIAIAA